MTLLINYNLGTASFLETGIVYINHLAAPKLKTNRVEELALLSTCRPIACKGRTREMENYSLPE